MAAARLADMMLKPRLLGIDYFTDLDTPEGKSLKEFNSNVTAIANILEGKMAKANKKLLWGTANMFSNRRFMAGAATNPDPDIFAYCAAQVKHCLDVTKGLGGENYVMWGGREGYETLINTNIGKETGGALPFARCRVQAQDWLQGANSHRAQAQGADQAPV
jgi:xylose isomerase